MFSCDVVVYVLCAYSCVCFALVVMCVVVASLSDVNGIDVRVHVYALLHRYVMPLWCVASFGVFE